MKFSVKNQSLIITALSVMLIMIISAAHSADNQAAQEFKGKIAKS